MLDNKCILKKILISLIKIFLLIKLIDDIYNTSDLLNFD